METVILEKKSVIWEKDNEAMPFLNNIYIWFSFVLISQLEVSLADLEMKFIILILLLLIKNNTIMGKSVGVIRNSTLRLYPSFYMIIHRSNCNKCLCAMFTGIGNESIVSLNCFKMNTSQVACQLFNQEAYRRSSSYQMEINMNSIFYFLQLPSNNLSIDMTTSRSPTMEGKISDLLLILNSKPVPVPLLSNFHCLSS